MLGALSLLLEHFRPDFPNNRADDGLRGLAIEVCGRPVTGSATLGPGEYLMAFGDL